jgi:hypothetical protein
MKATILEMRENGVVRPRDTLKMKSSHKGELEIIDMRENSYNRILKLANLRNELGKIYKPLFGVSILWLTDDKLGLTGFERIMKDGELVDYARSWVCRMNSDEAGRSNEHVTPRRDNFRH